MREYRESGVEPIGVIPREWDCVRVSRVLEKSEKGIMVGPFGSSLTNAVIGGDQGAYKIYGQANLIRRDFCYGDKYISESKYRELQNYEVIPGDVVVSMMGTIGKCRVVPEGIQKGIMDSHLIKLRLGKEIDPYFFVYAYESVAVYDQIMAKSKGSIMTGLNSSIVKSLFIPLPELYEQRKIIDYLDKENSIIDSLIDEVKASIEEYKAWKASIIYEAVTKGLDKDAEMKDSGVEWIGNMPVHWNHTLLKNLCDMQSGRNLTSEQIADEGEYPVYGGNGIRGYYDSYNTEGEFLTVGRQGALCGNVHRVTGQVWATEHAVVTRPKEQVDLGYLYYELIAMNLNQYASNTAAQPGLAVGAILAKQALLPPMAEQKAIGKHLDMMSSSIDSLISEKESLISDLEAYKKSLIFETVTGKRKVV